MDIAAFLGLEPTDRDHVWRLPVTPAICTGFNFLFGGAAMAAATAGLEATTGRPLIWATAQYLSFVRPPSVMDITVEALVVGNQVTQARATGTADGNEIIAVTAALGARSMEASGTWLAPPAVPSPEDCPEATHFRGVPTGIRERLDARLAEGRTFDQLDGSPGTGRTLLWVRLPELDELGSGALGILADHVPFGISQALGLRAGGNSLDNTLRVVRLVPTEWALLDMRIDAVANGFAHGHIEIWSQDGVLMATGAQSAVVRFWNE